MGVLAGNLVILVGLGFVGGDILNAEGSIGIRDLAGNLEIIYGLQLLRGKIFNPKGLFISP